MSAAGVPNPATTTAPPNHKFVDPASNSPWDEADPETAQLRFTRGLLDAYENDGYGKIERQLTDSAKRLTLSDLVTKSRSQDEAVARRFGAAAASNQMAGLSRFGRVVYDPLEQGKVRRDTVAAQVQGRNQGIQDAVMQRDLARAGLAGIAGDYDAVGADSFNTVAAADAILKRDNALAQAHKKASDKAAIGNLVGTAATAAAIIFSSHELKTDKEPVTILDKLASVPVERWRYKGEFELHIGPYAEDFNAAFGLSAKPYIHVIDFLGVLLGAVKELNDKVEEQKNVV